MFSLRTLLVATFFVVGVLGIKIFPAEAAVITWDGGGVTNNWSEDANWSGDVEPGTSDVATFDATSTKNATIDANISVQGIDINTGYSGVITQSSGFTVTVGSGNFDISAGTFTGGDSTIDINSSFTVSGGTFTSTSGTMTIATHFTVSSGSFEHGNGTITSDVGSKTWNVATNETFNNLIFNLTGTLTITSGDTLIVEGDLTLTSGAMATGTIDVRGDVTVSATYSGGTGIIDLGDNAVVQTVTLNGGTSPTVRFDAAADANDSIVYAAQSTMAGLTTTAGFSGAIPISNPSNYTLTFTGWTQAAGTFDGSIYTNFVVDDLSITGGTFTAPTNVSTSGINVSVNVNTTQTFNNLTLDVTAGSLTISSGDTLVVTGTLAINDCLTTGTISAQGSTITQNATCGGTSSTIVDFDSASAQTYTSSGGRGPVLRFDSAADASDSVVFAAAGQLQGITTTSGFSGTVPLSNPSNFTLGIFTVTHAAGTLDLSSAPEVDFDDLVFTGGTFVAPTLLDSSIGSAPSIDANSTLTINDLYVGAAAGNFAVGTGDTITVTGDMTVTRCTSGGTISLQGDLTQNAGCSSSSTTTVDFASASVQTWTANAGVGPVARFDAAEDANDVITFSAAATLYGVTTTSGFSGTWAPTNTSDFIISISQLVLGGGTLNFSGEASMVLDDITQTGTGTWSAPTLVSYTTTFSQPTYTVEVDQSFNNVTVNFSTGSFIVSSGDTYIVTGNFICENGGTNATGTLELRGDVTLNSGCDSQSMAYKLSGSATQTLSDNTTGNSILNADVSVDKSGGQVNLSTALVLNATNQDLTLVEGKLNLAGQNLTVNGTSGTMVVEDGGNFQLQGAETITLNASNPTLSTGSTVTYTGNGNAGANTYTVTTLKSTYHHLVINSTDGATDVFQLGAALDVNGNLTVTAGNFDVTTTNYAITLAGNWSNAGTFTPRSGTVTLDANTSHSITGATTWYNLTLQDTSDNSTDTTITFASSATQTITGALTLDGLDGNDRLVIAASSGGSRATLDFTGSSTFTGDYLLVTDNTATDNSSGITSPLVPANSANGGNTSGWFPVDFGGTVFSDEGVTNIGSNITVRLLKNGADTSLTDDTDASGIYSIDISGLTLSSGDVLTVYLDDETPNGVTVTRYDSGSVASLNVYQDFLIVQHEDAGPITNTNLDTADNADPGSSSNDISSIYTVSGGTLTTASSSIELLVGTGETYTPGGAIDSNGTLDINGTLSAAANAINVAGHLENSGTLTHTGVLTFDGTTAQTFTPGGSTIGSDIVIANTSDAVSLSTNALNIGSNDLTINSSAILALAGQNLTASGTFSNTGTLRARGSETITLTPDTNSGTFEYIGDADSAADTFTLPDLGATDYYNLTIATTDSGDILQSGAAKTIAGALTITSGTYGANTNTTAVTGLTTVSGGIYLASTATQTLTGLTVSGGVFTGSSGTVDVNGTVTLSSGTLTAPSGSFTIQGNFSDTGGTFSSNSGTVTFDANANHTISGSNTWRNITLQNTSDDATDVTLTIEASSTQTFTGTLTLDGLDADDRLNIVSSAPGTAAVTVFNSAAAFSGDYLDITDNTVTDNSSAITLPINPSNTINGGNAGGWFLATFDGIVYTDEAVTELGTGRTIRLLQNGVDTGLSADTNASSIYSLDVTSLALNPGDILTFYIDDETDNGVTVMRYDAVTIGSINIYRNYLLLRHEDAGPITNANLDTADNADPGSSSNDISSIYSVSGGTLTTQSNIELLITSGDTFTPGGALDAGGTIDIDGTLNAEANAVSVARNFDNAGTFTHTGTLTFDGTTNQTFTPGGAAFNSDVVIAATNAVVSLATNALDIGANDLTINANTTLSLAGRNLTASGTFTNNGTLRLQGVETLTLTQDTNSGTFEYLGDAGGAVTTFTLIDFGSTDYYNLIIDHQVISETMQSSAAKVIAGTLEVGAGTYSANGNTTTVAGATTITGGTYSAGSATQTFSSLTLTSGTFTGGSGTVDVNGALTLTSGTFTAPSGSMTIQGNVVNNGATFAHNSGSVTLDANTNHSITGSHSWNNLTLVDSSDNETDVTLTIGSGTTQTINGILTLDGLDTTDRLVLVSSSSGSEATTTFEGSSTFSGDYLDIQDNTVTDNSSGVSAPIIPDNSTDSGNAEGWFAAASSGGGGGYVGGTVYDLELTYPNGGEVLTHGDQVYISWTSSGPSLTHVNILLSTDGGQTFDAVTSDVPNTGFYVWTVPDIATDDARILLEGTDLVTTITTDGSDEDFEIVGSRVEEEPTDEPDDGGDWGTGVAVPGDYIKGESFSTVYYLDDNLVRHPFYDEQTYFTHQDSFAAIKTVEDSDLANYPIGSPVLPKAGAVLVKILSVPQVYYVTVGEDGAHELHWIPSEELANYLFGENWADYVIDLYPTIWPHYESAEEVTDAWLIDRTQLKRRDSLHAGG